MADKEHPMPFRLELRNEMFEMVGRFAPGGGGGKGNNQSGGGSDFGQNGAVAMLPDCFPSSANNFDVSCAEATYDWSAHRTTSILGTAALVPRQVPLATAVLRPSSLATEPRGSASSSAAHGLAITFSWALTDLLPWTARAAPS